MHSQKPAETTILLRQADYTLELEKYAGLERAEYAFILHPTAGGKRHGRGITLLSGEGCEVPRRELHYAFYLMQRFQNAHAEAIPAKAAQA